MVSAIHSVPTTSIGIHEFQEPLQTFLSRSIWSIGRQKLTQMQIDMLLASARGEIFNPSAEEIDLMYS